MEVCLNRMDGLDDAITSLYFSKRTITKELENEIRTTVRQNVTRNGQILDFPDEKFVDYMHRLCKWGTRHITLLRFINLNFTVYGLHRAGQDDWDSHAYRFQNRIIRSSTRLADFKAGEMSDYYKGKIIPTDMALDILDITIPDRIEHQGKVYVRGVNGYILEEYAEDKDVKRGLYMESIPSNFIFSVQLLEFAHIYQERNAGGTANPEVKELAEKCADELERFSLGYFDREFLSKIHQ